MAYVVWRVLMKKYTKVRIGIRGPHQTNYRYEVPADCGHATLPSVFEEEQDFLESVAPTQGQQAPSSDLLTNPTKEDPSGWPEEVDPSDLSRHKTLSKSKRVKSYLKQKCKDVETRVRSRSKSASRKEKPTSSWYVEGVGCEADSRNEGGTEDTVEDASNALSFLETEIRFVGPAQDVVSEAERPQPGGQVPVAKSVQDVEEIEDDEVPRQLDALDMSALEIVLPPSEYMNTTQGLQDDCGSPLEVLVDSYFGSVYPNYTGARCTLIRQARDLLVTSYMGSLSAFESEFCQPASRIARRLATNPAIQWKGGCGCAEWGWPLSRGARGVVLHLGRVDGSLLQEGDAYLSLEPELCLRHKGGPAPACLGPDPEALAASPPLALAMDDHLCESLACLLVSVERTLDRVPVERLAFPCSSCGLLDPSCRCPDHAPPPNTRDSSIQTSPIYELDASIPHIDSDEEHEPNSHSSCNVVASLHPARRLSDIPDYHLNAGIYLPGLHDCEGRALVLFDASLVHKSGLSPPECARVLIYYSTMPVLEERTRNGITLICMDGPLDILDHSLSLVSGQVMVHNVIFFTPERHGYSSNILKDSQTEIIELKTVVDLERYIPSDQVPYMCGGSNRHDQPAWVEFFKEIELMKERCCETGRRLVSLLGDLSGCDPYNKTVHQQSRSVARLLHDTDVIRLRREAPSVISSLANTASLSLPHSEDARLSVEKTGRLFSEVDKTVKRLEELAEKRREKLKDISKIRALEHETEQVLSWLNHKGDDWLRKHAELAVNLPALKQQEVDFEKFYFISMRHLDKGGDLVEEAGQCSGNNSNGLKELARTLKTHLLGFSDRLEDTRERLEDASRCYYLLDRAYEWGMEVKKYMSRVKPDDSQNPEQSVKQLRQYLMAHPAPTSDHFSEMIALASKLQFEKLIQQCKTTQRHCEETIENIRSILGNEGVTRWSSSTPLPGRRMSAPSCGAPHCDGGHCGGVCPGLNDISEEEACLYRPNQLQRSCTWQYPTENFEEDDKLSSSADNTTEGSESGTKSEDMDDHNEAYGKALSPIPVNSHLHNDFSVHLDVSGGTQTLKNKKTMLLIMREMIQTERDYVQSLEYVIENYIPELIRDDIPQAMRGQRNVIFGNIEKIYEFHSQYFLQELERCENSPLHVGQCFLKYENKFYLYALYNKNKPKSDSLMSEYGTSFFKGKQLELGDKMDLASYLLKPVQRMGKYALLLQQLMKAWPRQEVQELRAAETMVRFQLRHGNDLLAMDSLRDCDVNVKEQGRLLRQNEFLVWQGKNGKKYCRHVFLFEELILFSKAKRFPDRKNLDIYIYKHSIKTSDIGLTAKVGDSSTKFEIWFRKRKPNDTYTLQCLSEEVKQAWTEELSNLLWKQAMRNRELRLAEMTSMGIGNKPCLDIRPSINQISDRSISITQLTKTAPRFRNSIAISPVEQIRKRPHSIISVSSSSSSTSSGSSSSGSVSSSMGEHKHSQCSSAESGIVADWNPASHQSSVKL